MPDPKQQFPYADYIELGKDYTEDDIMQAVTRLVQRMADRCSYTQAVSKRRKIVIEVGPFTIEPAGPWGGAKIQSQANYRPMNRTDGFINEDGYFENYL